MMNRATAPPDPWVTWQPPLLVACHQWPSDRGSAPASRPVIECLFRTPGVLQLHIGMLENDVPMVEGSDDT
jgi:hypothetical protein